MANDAIYDSMVVDEDLVWEDDYCGFFMLNTQAWTANDYLNFEDMNRIETNIEILKNLLNLIDLTAHSYAPNVLRDRQYIELVADLERIESAILEFKLYTPPSDWETPKTDWSVLDIIDYNVLNRFDNNSRILFEMYKNVVLKSKTCGESRAICGATSNFL